MSTPISLDRPDERSAHTGRTAASGSTTAWAYWAGRMWLVVALAAAALTWAALPAGGQGSAGPATSAVALPVSAGEAPATR